MTTSLSASWLPWVCLAMVLLIWLSCVMQPQYLRGLLSNGFSVFSVNAAEQLPSIGSQATQWIFNTIVPAIGIYVSVTESVMYGTELLGWLVLLSILADGLRALVAMLVNYTFRLGKTINLAYMRYFSLRSIFTFVLFTLVLLVLYTDPGILWMVVLGVASVVYMVILGWQWGRLFCTSLIDLAGLLLYMLTVELLPAVLLFEAGRQLYMLQFA